MSEHLPLEDLIRQRILDRSALSGLSVVNQAGESVLRLYDIIGDPFISADAVAAALDSIDSAAIEVQINSPGGSVFDSVAIYNMLRAHPAKITTRVDALAASGASIIAQAGDRRVMLESSELMIHEAHGFAIGATADNMREMAELLDKQSDKLAEIYARAAGDPDKAPEFLEMMSASATNMGTWFSPEEAVAAGLADEVVAPSRKVRNQVNPPNRFTDQLAEAVASLEQVTAEAENVMTFRSEQGKTPLSDEAVALVDKAVAALTGLKAEPETEDIQPSTTSSGHLRDLDLIVHETEVASQKLRSMQNA